MSCCRPICGPICGPSCAIPSCASAPVIPLGSCGVGSGYCGYGGGAASASSLGIIPGVPVSCVNQIPPSEVVIQPAPVAVVLPGPILAATCESVAVGGYSPCASGSGGYLGSSGICRPKRKFSICGSPC